MAHWRRWQSTQITLPELATLKTLSLNAASGNYMFVAQITKVNGSADADVKNDVLSSYFTVAPTWPNTITIYMKTNSAGAGVGQNPSETSWKITDAAGNTVASRTGADVNTIYDDTVSFPRTGMYKLTVTDGGCDGLYWWVYGQNPQFGITSGNIVVRNANTGINIPVKGNTYSGTYHDDFGCGFSQSFTAMGWPAAVNNTVGTRGMRMVVFPNPATRSVQTKLFGINNISGTFTILDVVGRPVLAQTASAAINTINISTLAPGLYNVVYSGANGEKLTAALQLPNKAGTL